MIGALFDTAYQLYALVWSTASSAILLAVLSLVASLIGYGFLTAKDALMHAASKWFGTRTVELRVETPDELFFWINRWIISLPSYAKQTRFADLPGGGAAAKKKKVLADDSDGSIYFQAEDLNAYRICTERAMMREQAGTFTQRKYGGTTTSKKEIEDERWSVVFLPGNSAHSLHFKGKKVLVLSGADAQQPPQSGGGGGSMMGGGGRGFRAMAQAAVSGGGGGGGGGSSANKDKQVLVLRTAATDLAVLHELVQEAIAYSRKVHERKIYLWQSMDSYNPYLTISGEYDPDSFCHPELPILPVNTVKSLLEDVGKFLKSEDFYHRMGVPYRRGYLLYGVPGSGKTTLVRKLAAAHKLDVCMISLTGSPRDSFLSQLFSNAPRHSILLLEDVDVAFPSADVVSKRAEEKKKAAAANGGMAMMAMGGGGPRGRGGAGGGGDGMTMSGLFNAIDGIEAQTGCILIMTTNHIEHLDPALIRSGRIDVKIPFDYAAPRECALAFHRFYPDQALAVPDAAETRALQTAEADRKHAEELEMRRITREVTPGMSLAASADSKADDKKDKKADDKKKEKKAKKEKEKADDKKKADDADKPAAAAAAADAKTGDDTEKEKAGDEKSVADGKPDATAAAADDAKGAAKADKKKAAAAAAADSDDDDSDSESDEESEEDDEKELTAAEKKARAKAKAKAKEARKKLRAERRAEEARAEAEAAAERRAEERRDKALAEEEAKQLKSPAEQERERVELGVSALAYAFGQRAARLTRKPRLTMSDIQGHLLKYRDSPQLAYVMVEAYDPRNTAKTVKPPAGASANA